MTDSPDVSTPGAILDSPTLTRTEKIAKLRELAYDARERAVAAEEGMAGSANGDLAAIQRALRELDADEGADSGGKQ